MISGLEGGLVGLFTKLHHATIDGASGVELLHVLLDTEPEGRVIEPPASRGCPSRRRVAPSSSAAPLWRLRHPAGQGRPAPGPDAAGRWPT